MSQRENRLPAKSAKLISPAPTGTNSGTTIFVHEKSDEWCCLSATDVAKGD